MGSRAQTLLDLLQSGEMTLSYRFGVKPTALKGIPPIRYGVLLEDTSTEPSTLRYKAPLDTIPAKYRGGDPHLRLLRQDGLVRLSDLKAFHGKRLKALGKGRDVLLAHCACLDVSIDGVKESNHGNMTFFIVSVRFGGGAIYLWRVYHHVLGDANAKPSIEETLR